jgi:hypothetical protein
MSEGCGARLARLLEEERAALRAGALDRLPDLLARKEALCAEVESHGLGCSKDDMARLAEMARLNADFLDAARAGLRAAIERLSECSTVARSVVTYTPEGERQALAVPAPKVHRRA